MKEVSVCVGRGEYQCHGVMKWQLTCTSQEVCCNIPARGQGPADVLYGDAQQSLAQEEARAEIDADLQAENENNPEVSPHHFMPSICAFLAAI